jgi:hypothetical protein
MRKKLTRTGNSLALVLGKLKKIVTEAHTRYGGVFRRLAE